MNTAILGIGILLIVLYAWMRAKNAPTGLSAADLKTRMDQENLVLIDVRNPGEYSGPLGHIPGARLKPLSQIGKWADSMKKESSPVILICHVGNRSRTAARILASRGIATLNLKGGMAAWHRQGYPVE